MKKIIPVLVSLSFLFVTGCGTVALVKKEEWEQQKAETEAMKNEFRLLQGKLEHQNEEQAQQLKLFKADLQMMFADVNRGISQVSGQLEESQNDLKNISKTTEKLSERKYVIKTLANPADSASAKQAGGNQALVVEDRVDVQKLFDIAKKDFNTRDYDRAQKEFEELLVKFPKDETADDCAYWIGEIFFVKKQYKEALAQYQKAVADFPQGDIQPPALFKQGLCQEKLNNREAMKKVWADLIAKYPYSDEAMQAKVRLGQ